MLLDKIGVEKANKNRELKVKFLKNLAKLLFGLLEMKAGSVFNDKDVDNQMSEVIDCWNSKPFVFIESKKLAGGKTVSERAIENALLRDEVFDSRVRSFHCGSAGRGAKRCGASKRSAASGAMKPKAEPRT